MNNFIPNMIINCVSPHFRITYWLASDKGRYFRMPIYPQSNGQDIWLSVHYKGEINKKPEASSNKKTATEDRKTKDKETIGSQKQKSMWTNRQIFWKEIYFMYQLSASYPQHLERFEAKSANLIMNDSDPDTKEKVTE